jgi:hypothetical protein
MRRFLEPHRYTGDLEESVTWRYDPTKRELRVGSELQRGGQYSAINILEYGTGPIKNLPFTPIARWAAFKGLPAGPVWMAIRDRGVKKHPIMENLTAHPEFEDALNMAAKKLGTDILVKGFGIRKEFKG